MIKKDYRVKRLTRENVGTFFTKLSRGDIIIYSEAFTLEDVYRLAYRHGWLLSYYPSGTTEYTKYGCPACRTMWRV